MLARGGRENIVCLKKNARSGLTQRGAKKAMCDSARAREMAGGADIETRAACAAGESMRRNVQACGGAGRVLCRANF